MKELIWIDELQKEEHGVFAIGIFEDEQRRFSELSRTLTCGLQKTLDKHTSWAKEKCLHIVATEREDVIVVGLGKRELWDRKKAETVGGMLYRFIAKEKINQSVIHLDSFGDDEDLLQSFTTGLTLGSYVVETFKTDQRKRSLPQIKFYSGSGSRTSAIEVACNRGVVQGFSTNEARRLVNTPANYMTPTVLAEEAMRLGEEFGIHVKVFEKNEMEEMGMGALLAVAKGSDEPPKFITMEYKGNVGSDEWDGAIVGKGLTYDSGGYSLKTGEGLKTMKMDMGGAASVLGAMRIILEEKPKVNVMAVIPSTENMINGNALKPGDVIHSLGGKTIEVLNTDAEGRLILADAVAYARKEGAKAIIDVATLTGSVVVALGGVMTGAVTNNVELMGLVHDASEVSGERVWLLPNDEEYVQMVKKSDVADLNNSPGRKAGAITAGLFIGEFAEDTPWVHLDIAGTAWQEGVNATGQKGGTGVMVRTIAETVLGMDKR
ncbi:leucyl aminopeptidase [Alteribacter aurantiacus]|uniref:leucyl aminopeptidase n=1 Tax=Alteribacter aurantiacus TaxID=254410 RepID=UPI00041B7C10|nr:leucyl aminopeptidase [Alteribacter aurantiacus]